MAKVGKLNDAELASFFYQISIIYGNDINILVGISTMLEDTKSSAGRVLLEKIKEEIDNNNTFSEAIMATDAFPEHCINMIRMGEETGRITETARALSEYYDRQSAISESIKNAVSYPMIMIFMMLLVIIVLITKVLPIFDQVFAQLGSQMNAFSTSLMKFGNRLSSSSIILVVVLCLVVAAFVFFDKVPQGQKMLAHFLDVFPPTRKFNEAVACSRFASGLAMIYDCNTLSLYEGFKLVKSLIDNPHMAEKIDRCEYMVNEEHTSLHEALKETSIFSSFHSSTVAVAEESSIDDLAETLKRIANSYDKEVDKRIHDIISILEPTLVIILSLIVGMILLSVILPLMGIMSSIG